MGPTSPTSPSPHERAAALLRRQQSTTARLRAGLTRMLDDLEELEEPSLFEVEGFGMRPIRRPAAADHDGIGGEVPAPTADAARGVTGDANPTGAAGPPDCDGGSSGSAR